MLVLVAVLFIVRMLSARAQRKGYPSYLAALGVLGWVAGEALVLGVLAGEHVGGLAALLADIGGGIAGALAAFVVIHRLPDRSRALAIDAIEETFE